ncbi:hypothetical protein [Paenibacillus turpanensis]|uniref:hypothetical protein n=1 Tax=Paenibacillus turpanensis TaxID=2689078 RepID=UPI001A9D930B|nr:hypothetical protein [Paenibacillus turpanensis]
MTESGSLFAFIIVSFAFAFILILKKDTIAPPFRRGLALLSIVMVASAFTLLIIHFLRGAA